MKPRYASMFFAVDFDGTIFKHKYPAIGDEIPGAIDTIKLLQSKGHKVILYTMRHDDSESELGSGMLREAVQVCRARGVEFWGTNHNPEQINFSKSPKVWANVYIDDAALGCPLIYPEDANERPYVNWKIVAEHLVRNEYISISDYLDLVAKTKYDIN